MQIVDEISITNFRPFIICLGLTVNKWEDILYQYDVNGLMGVKLMAMYELITEKETISHQVRFKDLWKSLNFIEIWPHYLCQVSVYLFTQCFIMMSLKSSFFLKSKIFE